MDRNIVQELCEALEKSVNAMNNAVALMSRARNTIPDEEEGLAAQVFSHHINWADGPLIEATEEARAALAKAGFNEGAS